jgi:phosphoadenosine phosphosulfate reductase
MSDKIDIAKLVTETANFAPEALLAWVAERFAGRVALASSLGAEDQVLTDMVAREGWAIPVFTLDTGRLPPETYDLLEATRTRYGLAIEVLFPNAADVEPLVSERGPNFFRRSVEDRRQCCQVRKVRPLQRRLAGLGAWITGLRREQAVTRARLERVEWDESYGLVKINPLADWTETQVWDYLRAHEVPYNALHDCGYPSIGCAPCTRAVKPGADVRAGRWWWETPEHKECGLHGNGNRETFKKEREK